jgi:hypothetical protein
VNARTTALLTDFLVFAFLGFVSSAVVVLEGMVAAGPDRFDARQLLWALLGALIFGLVGAVRKFVAPQLVSISMPTNPAAPPTVVGVALKDLDPPPMGVDYLRTSRSDVDAIDKTGAGRLGV